MKKSIYILGMFCLSLTLIATIFKVMHFPGAAILLLTSLSSMALVFLPIALNAALKATSDKLLKFVYVAAFISFSVDFIGMIFKILHWPGGAILMTIGVPLPFVLFMPAYIIYHNKRKLKTDFKFFGIIGFMVYLGVISSFLALDVSYSALNGHVKTAKMLSETNYFLEQNTNSNSNSKELVEQINLLKKNIILLNSEENDQFNFTTESVDYSMIHNKSSYLNWDKFQDAGFNVVNASLNNYLGSLANNNDEINRLVNEINYYRLQKIDNEPIIRYLKLIAILNILTDWQNKILLIEYYKTNNL